MKMNPMGLLAALFAAVLGVCLHFPVAQAVSPRAPITWQISETKVESPGKVTKTAEGETRTGMVITGKAVNTATEAIFPEGAFRCEYSIIRPAGKAAKDKKATWQLRGKWSITASNADPALMKSRYNPYVVSGSLKAVLPFDPTAETGSMAAEVTLQSGGMRPWAGPRAKGSFAGNSKFEGTLTTPFIQMVKKQGKEISSESVK
jgi:hypothetical protein